MKKAAILGISLLLVIGLNSVQAQIRKIPAAVTEAFKAKYPDAKEVEFKDRLTFFQVNFEMNDTDYEARYTNKGEWEQTEKGLDEDGLPAEVQDGLKKSKYADWEIKGTSLIEYSDEHIEYKISIKRGTLEKKYLFFNKDGQLLRDVITL